jgi:hypothetical protein
MCSTGDQSRPLKRTAGSDGRRVVGAHELDGHLIDQESQSSDYDISSVRDGKATCYLRRRGHRHNLDDLLARFVTLFATWALNPAMPSC